MLEQIQSAALAASMQTNPATSFSEMHAALQANFPLRASIFVSESGQVRCIDFELGDLQPEMVPLISHPLRTEIYPVRTLMSSLAEQYSQCDCLLIPVTHADVDHGGLLFILEQESGQRHPSHWAVLGRALAHVIEQDARNREVDLQRREYRQRVHQLEALEVLGLAANRTLDPLEVAGIVARVTRTLFSADLIIFHRTLGGADEQIVLSSMPDLQVCIEPELMAAARELTGPIHLKQDNSVMHGSTLRTAAGIKSCFLIPIALQKKQLGVLLVGYTSEFMPSKDDYMYAASISRHASVAFSNAELYVALQQKTAELSQAYEQLKTAAGAKERFFNVMNHELRTPITAIKGYCDLLLDGVAGELPPTATEYLHRSQKATRTVLGLVNELLDYAKIEAGKTEFFPAFHSTEEVLADALDAVRPQASAKQLDLNFAGFDAIPQLFTDRKLLSRILVNLLSNAIKFTTTGSVQLFCTVRALPVSEQPGAAAETALISIAVADTGSGISEEYLDTIFLEYEQTPGSEGTGLGLPICMKLAGVLGGTISVESEIGRGSVFRLDLPQPASVLL